MVLKMLAWNIAFIIVTILAAALVMTGVALSFIGPMHAVLFAAVAVTIAAQKPLRSLAA